MTPSLALSLIPCALFWFLTRKLQRISLTSPMKFALCFLWGAALAPAGVLLGGSVESEGFTQVVLWTPFLEEAFKGACLMVMVIGIDRSPLSGWLMGATVGLGFATIENFLVFTVQAGELSTGEWILSASLRILLPTLMHLYTTATLGWVLGEARGRSRFFRWITAPSLGYALAVLAHGVYNAAAWLSYARSWHLLLFLSPLFFLWAGKRTLQSSQLPQQSRPPLAQG